LLIDRIKGGQQYLSGQYKSLTKEEKERVAQYREESKKKKKKKSVKKKSKAHKRWLSKATTKREGSDDAEGQEEETSGVGSQFRMNGNRNKKSKKD
jgi:hypothetical protein